MTSRRIRSGFVSVVVGIVLMAGLGPAWATAPTGPGEPQPPVRVSERVSEQDSVNGQDYVAAAANRRLNAPQVPPSGGVSAQARRQYSYAISVVSIPVAGLAAGPTKSGMRTMINDVGARMLQQTNGRVTYRFHAWNRTPMVRSSELPCDVDSIHNRYDSYAKGLRHTPAGYTDTIAIYVTPLRYRCPFAGIAILGGDGLYLNGVDLADPQRLQYWITAHELGHNLGLVHSGSFSAARSGWNVATDAVPEDSDQQVLSEYGDYLDFMGQPANGGEDLFGADYADWVIDGVNLFNLGVLPESQLKIVRRTGTYVLAPVQPTGSPTPPSVIAIPVLADGSKSYWVLEYRPASQSASSGLNYPEPWLSLGYGVRLISTEHEAGFDYSINKVFHLTSGRRAQAHLPPATVELGGQATVAVLGESETGATLQITIPSQLAATSPWPSPHRVGRADKGARLPLPIWTDQTKTITWSVTDGLQSCSVDDIGKGFLRRSELVKSTKYGTCVLRARARPFSYAFYAALDTSARYVFRKHEVSREFLP